MTKAGSGSQHLDPALACLGACALSMAFHGPAWSGEPLPAIHCVVEAEQSGPSLVIHGRIFSDREVAGRYSLRASRTGGGASNVAQSGDFHATRERPATVGTITLGGPGETQATLTARVGEQTVSCRLE